MSSIMLMEGQWIKLFADALPTVSITKGLLSINNKVKKMIVHTFPLNHFLKPEWARSAK